MQQKETEVLIEMAKKKNPDAVPEIVQIKADIAFSKIKMERENAVKETMNKENTTNINKRRKTFTRLLLGILGRS